MPITLNLLAEQIAAEELRRKDPLKRAIMAGIVVVVLLLFYSLMLQAKVLSARGEAARLEGRLKAIEDQSKQVKTDRALVSDVEKRIGSLEKFSTNRMLWGSTFDALQRTPIPNIRLTEVVTDQKYTLFDTAKFFTTNVVVNIGQASSAWKFWAAAPNPPAIETLVSNELKVITKRFPFSTNTIEYTTKITPIGTNATGDEITTRVEFTLPQIAREQTTLQITGRDYAPPPGVLDDYTRQMASLPYFKERLSRKEGGGIIAKDRPAHQRTDSQESFNPIPFLPFTIECTFEDRVLANE